MRFLPLSAGLAFFSLLSSPATQAASPSWREACRLGLQNFTVYSVESPVLERSDILGLTGSENSVLAQHFAFVRRYETQDHTRPTADACRRLTVLTGGRLKDLKPSSVSVSAQSRPAAAPQLGDAAPIGTQIGIRGEKAPDLSRITQELEETSRTLLQRATRGIVTKSAVFRASGLSAIHAFSIDGEDLEHSGTWSFVGTSQSLFLITVRGTRPLSLNAGISLLSSDGRSLPQPGNIAFHFPDAERIEWRRGGASPNELGYNVGYPLIVIAPRAHVAASELLITGAVYAKRFTGAWDFTRNAPASPAQTPTAQVNGVLPNPAFGIGTPPPASGR